MSKTLFEQPPSPGEFQGETYDARLDRDRLTGQLLLVWNIMSDGRWRTLYEIQQATRATLPAISARLRDLRKERFGSYTVERRQRGALRGLYEYRVGPKGSGTPKHVDCEHCAVLEGRIESAIEYLGAYVDSRHNVEVTARLRGYDQ